MLGSSTGHWIFTSDIHHSFVTGRMTFGVLLWRSSSPSTTEYYPQSHHTDGCHHWSTVFTLSGVPDVGLYGL